MREFLKVLLLSAIQGVLMGLAIAAGFLLILRISVESPMVPKQPEFSPADFALSRLSLPFPDPTPRIYGPPPCVFLSDSLLSRGYA
jgi:hypothetical protein